MQGARPSRWVRTSAGLISAAALVAVALVLLAQAGGQSLRRGRQLIAAPQPTRLRSLPEAPAQQVGAAAVSGGKEAAPAAKGAEQAAEAVAATTTPAWEERQFTLVTLSHAKRMPCLKVFTSFYSQCSSVAEIVIVWSNSSPPDPEVEFPGLPVRIRNESTNSLNNRFRPDPDIRTRAILQLDDDIIIRCADVERAFSAWRQEPDLLVGFFPRLITPDPPKYYLDGVVFQRRTYNTILTKGTFMTNEAFEMYWGPDNDAGRAIVDELFNCEDILLAFTWAAHLQQAKRMQRSALYSNPVCFLETSPLSRTGISYSAAHLGVRDECVARFTALLGGSALRNETLGSAAPDDRNAVTIFLPTGPKLASYVRNLTVVEEAWQGC